MAREKRIFASQLATSRWFCNVIVVRGIAMSDPLASYLNDHPGGAQIAIQVLEAMRDQHDDPRFRDFANELLPRFRTTIAHSVPLQRRSARAQARPNKPVAGFLKKNRASKARSHRLNKLQDVRIAGASCAWDTRQVVSLESLEVANQSDSHLREYDFKELIDRAKQQYDKVESRRLDLVQAVLLSAPEERSATQCSMSKVIVYATVISGFVAAYLMYRRGESMVSIARKTVTDRVGSLVSEVQNTV